MSTTYKSSAESVAAVHAYWDEATFNRAYLREVAQKIRRALFLDMRDEAQSAQHVSSALVESSPLVARFVAQGKAITYTH